MDCQHVLLCRQWSSEHKGRSRTTVSSGSLTRKHAASHTIIGSSRLRYGYLGQCYERGHLTQAGQNNAGRHTKKWNNMCCTNTPIIPSDINPPFMLHLMPAPPGLTRGHAPLQIWQPTHGTDGRSIRHRLLSFFQPGRCQNQNRVQTHLAECIQWGTAVSLSPCPTGQWLSL